MPVQQYLSALEAMRTQPTQANADALVNMLANEPQLSSQAKPQLAVHPVWSSAFRAEQPDATFNLHNTHMPMPRALANPTNLNALLDTLRRSVAQLRGLRAMGDGWGFANACWTIDTLVHCIGLDDVLPLEEGLLKSTVDSSQLFRFEAGITIDKLNAALTAQGRALLQQPGFGGLTFMGCASAGGHGSGLSIQGISGMIEAVELATLNDGNQVRLVRVERSNGISDVAKWRAQYPAPTFDIVQDDGLFHAARCGQGHLGVVYAVTVRTQPKFNLNESRIFTTWDAVWPTVQQQLVDPAIHSLHVWINPYLNDGKTSPTCVVTTLRRTTDAPRGKRGWGIEMGGMNPLTDLLRLFISIAPGALPALLDSGLKTTVATDVVMPSPQALDFGAPNTLPVYAASLGFDAKDADACLRALVGEINSWKAQNQWVSSPMGMRWVKASEDYLSPQYARDTIMLEVPVLKGTPNAVQTLDRYATYMMQNWGGRPHWGQQNPMGRALFEKNYGVGVKNFVSGFRTFNPRGFFDGALTEQLGLRDIANGR